MNDTNTTTKPGVMAVLSPAKEKIIAIGDWKVEAGKCVDGESGKMTKRLLYTAKVAALDVSPRTALVDADALDEARATVERLADAAEAFVAMYADEPNEEDSFVNPVAFEMRAALAAFRGDV